MQITRISVSDIQLSENAQLPKGSVEDLESNKKHLRSKLDYEREKNRISYNSLLDMCSKMVGFRVRDIGQLEIVELEEMLERVVHARHIK